MTGQICAAVRLAVAAMFLNTAFVPLATAQDVMELDLAFKNGQLGTSHGPGAAADLQRARQPQERAELARRHPRRHRRQGA